MNDRNTTSDPVYSTELRTSDSYSSLHPLAACSDFGLCETHAAIGAANIQIALVTAFTGIAVSAIFALTLLAVYAFHAINGSIMPAPPWYVVNIATALFATGAVSAWRIPRPRKTNEE